MYNILINAIGQMMEMATLRSLILEQEVSHYSKILGKQKLLFSIGVMYIFYSIFNWNKQTRRSIMAAPSGNSLLHIDISVKTRKIN